MAKMGAVASASVCALVGGVVLAQYIFTMKKKTGKKTKIIEMVRGKEAESPSGPARTAFSLSFSLRRARGARRISMGQLTEGGP